ncbi:ulp1 protease family, C-terminal catalytic domain-containing protein [Tanacetum coccineum]|uniref:Ulp1 protease family, C-terminal catalytic domain-containing protein n=1 Tax=Tanacetum coccineum TaxID=301880 RepID=A0ABQ4XV50_9ASTR
MHEKTKYFDIDVHLVKEKVASGLIKTIKVDSKDNTADKNYYVLFCKEASKCQLFLPYGTNKVLCAIGMVYSAKQVHGKSVLQGHAKVHVDNVEANYKDYLLPVPTEEFSEIGETVLSFIQWPKKYIELTKASKSNQTRNKKIVAANTSTQTATKQAMATNKEPSTRKQTSPSLFRQEGSSNHIAAAPLTKSARPLNLILKRACVRSTYERWMRNADPTRSIHADVEPRVFGQSESFQVSVTSGDLMLLFTNGLLSSSIITLFAASILKIMQTVNMQSNKWNFVECNQQRYYWECGYYVMKWMHQFVTHQQHSFPKTYCILLVAVMKMYDMWGDKLGVVKGRKVNKWVVWILV